MHRHAISIGRALVLAVLLVSAAVAGVAPEGPAAADTTCSIASTLKLGSKGADVTCLEQRLIALGYRMTGPDTTFGASTKLAVKAYQQASGLQADGVVGPKTRASLGLVPPLPTPPPLVNRSPPR